MSVIEAYASLLIVVPLVVLFCPFLILAAFVSVKWLLSDWRQGKAEREADRAKFRLDGEVYPPTGRGMCGACQKAFDKVYFMSDGRRLCPQCYQLLEMNDQPNQAPRKPGPPTDPGPAAPGQQEAR